MRGRSRGFIIASWVAVAVWALVIFAMSAKTAGEMGSGIWHEIRTFINGVITGIIGPVHDPVSTLGHFSEYLVFGALLANAFASHKPLERVVVPAVAAASAYAVTDELHQVFVPGRFCDPVDWAVDTVAALIGAALVAALLRWRTRKREVGEHA